MRKLFANPAEALADLLHDGMTIAAGGFGVVGVPDFLIGAVMRTGVRDLTVISNNCGVNGFGLATLLENGQIRKIVCSFVGGCDLLEKEYLAGAVEIEFSPQGTLAERMRAGGAGIPGFYTRAGVGTLIAEGKETKVFDGVDYLLERGIVADLALVKAWMADTQGNLLYRQTARNFNPGVAMCGKVTVAEVELLVESGELDPNHIHTPGIFVHRLVHTLQPTRRFDIVKTRES